MQGTIKQNGDQWNVKLSTSIIIPLIQEDYKHVIHDGQQMEFEIITRYVEPPDTIHCNRGADVKMAKIVWLNSLKNIFEAIQTEAINYGKNKEYCFSIDEDGYLVLLKRIPDSERDSDFESEDLKSWPLNSSDGKVIIKLQTGEHRGTTITEKFLKALKIEFQG